MKNTDFLIFIISVLITLTILSMFFGCIKYNNKEHFTETTKTTENTDEVIKLLEQKIPDNKIIEYLKSIDFQKEDFDNVIKKLKKIKK